MKKSSNFVRKMLTLANGSSLPAVGYGTSVGNLDDATFANALNLALEAGYRHIDTALVYDTEKTIGKVLKTWFSTGKLRREEIFITTKLPLFGNLPESVEPYIKQSLSNLQLDYVDLYLIHQPFGVKRLENGKWLALKTDHGGLWKKMEEQVDLGRTRFIGVSNYNQSQIEKVWNSARIKPACLQVELHLHLQQRPLVDFCQSRKITVVGYSPLGAPDYNNRMTKFSSDFKRQELPDLFEDVCVAHIAQKHGKTKVQVMLRFLVQDGVVPIPKSLNFERMKENLEIFDFTLDEQDCRDLRSLEVGEKSRITHLKSIFPGIESHPDYPWK